jgi:hypothetical protein
MAGMSDPAHLGCQTYRVSDLVNSTRAAQSYTRSRSREAGFAPSGPCRSLNARLSVASQLEIMTRWWRREPCRPGPRGSPTVTGQRRSRCGQLCSGRLCQFHCLVTRCTRRRNVWFGTASSPRVLNGGNFCVARAAHGHRLDGDGRGGQSIHRSVSSRCFVPLGESGSRPRSAQVASPISPRCSWIADGSGYDQRTRPILKKAFNASSRFGLAGKVVTGEADVDLPDRGPQASPMNDRLHRSETVTRASPARVQFPPPPVSLNKRLPATSRGIFRLKPILTESLERAMTKEIGVSRRHETPCRGRRALLKALLSF